MLPFRASDIADWPISAEDLAPGYRAVFGYLPLAARRDDLEAQFPLHSQTPAPLNLSARAARILDRMSAARDPLRAAGFSFGASRLAVANPASGGCRYCGLCLHGCPWGLIYNAAQSIGTIRRRAGLIVDRVEEAGARVRLRTRARADGAPGTLECDRVFLACGTYQTARIMLNSQPSLGALTLRDSQYFLLPLLGAGAAGEPEAERLHTLSQIFLEVADGRISRYPAHLQIYTYNDLYPRAIRDKLRAVPWLAARVARAVSRRLLAIQGYLHSHESGTATVRLRGDALELVRVPDPRPARIVRKLARKLSRHSDALGFRPLAPLLNVGNPGQGAHAGGTLPMREHPGAGECDTLGRPTGFKRVHLVDASVLPSIPSTTITLTVMANAHRIGSAAHDG